MGINWTGFDQYRVRELDPTAAVYAVEIILGSNPQRQANFYLNLDTGLSVDPYIGALEFTKTATGCKDSDIVKISINAMIRAAGLSLPVDRVCVYSFNPAPGAGLAGLVSLGERGRAIMGLMRVGAGASGPNDDSRDQMLRDLPPVEQFRYFLLALGVTADPTPIMLAANGLGDSLQPRQSGGYQLTGSVLDVGFSDMQRNILMLKMKVKAMQDRGERRPVRDIVRGMKGEVAMIAWESEGAE
jgi:hypothetical protein